MKKKILTTCMSIGFVVPSFAQNIFPENANVGIGTLNPLKKLEVRTPPNDVISIGNLINSGQYTGIHFGYLEGNLNYRKSVLAFERLDAAARGKIHLLNNGKFDGSSADLTDARLTINYDGKIGINNPNPTAELDVNGEVKWSGFNAGNSRALKVGYSGGNYGGIGYNIDFTGTTGQFNRPLSDRSSYMEFWNGGFRFFGTNNSGTANGIDLTGGGSNLNFLAVLTPNGELGIGTSTPENKEGWDKVLEIKGIDHAKALVSSKGVTTGMWSHVLGYYGAPAGGIAGTYTDHPYSLITNKTPRMTVTSTGNIGVGTSMPENSEGWDKVLEIKGNDHAKTLVSSAGITTGIWSHVFGYYGAPAGGIAGTYTDHPYSLITNKTPRMTVTSDGNIGIGTTSPREKLSVNGKIRAHEIKVEVTNWPDYVFDDDYKLKDLEELEKYINANKHLPGVPAAKEVEMNGIALGEMSKVLLKKIEEMTLLMIGLKKENNQMRTVIKELKTKIKN